MSESDELKALLRAEFARIATDLDHRAQRQDLGHAGPSDVLLIVAQSFERLASSLAGAAGPLSDDAFEGTSVGGLPALAVPDTEGDAPVYELEIHSDTSDEPVVGCCEVCGEDAVIDYDGTPTCVSCGAEQSPPSPAD